MPTLKVGSYFLEAKPCCTIKLYIRGKFMKGKIRVAVLFGGRSAEHEVSIQSAKNVVRALDPKKYEVTLIGIDKRGKWYLNEASKFLLHAENPKLAKLNKEGNAVALVPETRPGQLMSLSGRIPTKTVDVVFPVLHGPFGEDGTMQGLLKLMDVPFVGPGVLGSAVGMDKDVQKRLLREAGIPVTDFLTFETGAKIHFFKIKKELGLPFFIKPANLGSSVGINKVKNAKNFGRALRDAFQFDNKILVEKFVPGREIECSVLGNENPIASLPGEIIPQHEFYSYEAKYIDENGARLETPAKLPKKTIKEVQRLAVKTFKTLCLEGMSRVDFFLKPDGKLIVNEVNTIPGFTAISMYPKLWEASGIPQKKLMNILIKLALERHQDSSRLKTSYS